MDPDGANSSTRLIGGGGGICINHIDLYLTFHVLAQIIYSKTALNIQKHCDVEATGWKTCYVDDKIISMKSKWGKVFLALFPDICVYKHPGHCKFGGESIRCKWGPVWVV